MIDESILSDKNALFLRLEATTESASHQFETINANNFNTTVTIGSPQVTPIQHNISSLFVTNSAFDGAPTGHSMEHRTIGPVFHVPPLDNINPPDIQNVDNSISDPPTSVIHAQHPDQPSDESQFHLQDGSKGSENENSLNKVSPSQQNKSEHFCFD